MFFLSAQGAENARLKDTYDVLTEIATMPDNGIPKSLMDKSECVVVFPTVKKAAFPVGGSYGRGVICRSGPDFRGPWSTPAMFALEGASFGLQMAGPLGNAPGIRRADLSAQQGQERE